MSDASRTYVTAVFGLEYTIARVPADAWDDPSPCSGWTVRQVAGHAMGVVRNIAARANGEAAPDAFTDVGSIAGPDPLASMRRHRVELLVALDRPGVLDRPVVSRVGTHTIDTYMEFMRSDAFVHSWDIATACGLDPMFDPAMIALVVDDYRRRDMVPLRVPGRYDAARSTSGDADALERLIAFTGRDPHWSRPAHPDALEALSNRQRQALRHAAAGRTNPEIAELMSVNIETVKSHLMHAYATLGLRNRTEAAAWWTHAIDNNT